MACQALVPGIYLRRKISDPRVDPASRDTSGTLYDGPIVVQNASMGVFLQGEFWECFGPVGLGYLWGDRVLECC